MRLGPFSWPRDRRTRRRRELDWSAERTCCVIFHCLVVSIARWLKMPAIVQQPGALTRPLVRPSWTAGNRLQWQDNI